MNQVAWRCRASTPVLVLLLGCRAAGSHFKINKTQPKEHHLTMEKQPNHQRLVWSDEGSCRACCFPWACRLRVLLILLLLHFLLHLPAPRSLAARGARRPVASAVQRGAPDERGLGFFQQSQRPTERRRPSSAQSDITASPHPCCTCTQRGIQDTDAAAPVRH